MKSFLTGGKAAVFFLMISTGISAQTITGITPNASAPQNIKVTITGSGTTFFQETSTLTNVWLTKGDEIIPATHWLGVDATTLEAEFDIPVSTPAGSWDVHISDSVDGELPLLAEGFLIYIYPDLNGDGRVDNEDLALLTRNWLKTAVEVPNCNGMTQAAAETSLAASSLTTGAMIWSYHDTIPANKVICTTPAAGSTVHPGSAVNMILSMGPYQAVEPEGMVWLDINDPGIAGHEGFAGQMSKYETTNAQYCHFLNNAMASGDITISGNEVRGACGFNEGEDFAGQIYYNLAGPGYTDYGASSGGAARIHYTAGTFRVDSGFENHPVTYVSWYGAAAFCNFYGYQLPTEWQWQAVADYNGSFTYGCGTAIHTGIANYCDSVHPQGTTAAGAFGSQGYGLSDMAGNVWEWTSTVSGTDRVIRGGAWNSLPEFCTVSARLVFKQINTSYSFGFRACR